jgi:hypothetical protein
MVVDSEWRARREGVKTQPMQPSQAEPSQAKKTTHLVVRHAPLHQAPRQLPPGHCRRLFPLLRLVLGPRHPRANHLLQRVIGPPADAQHGVARPQHAVERAGDGVRPAEHLHAHQGRLGTKKVGVDGLERLAAHVPVPVAVHARKHVRAHLVLPERGQHAFQRPLRPRVHRLERGPQPLLGGGQGARGLPLLLWWCGRRSSHGGWGGGGGGGGGRCGMQQQRRQPVRAAGGSGGEEKGPGTRRGEDERREELEPWPLLPPATGPAAADVGHVFGSSKKLKGRRAMAPGNVRPMMFSRPMSHVCEPTRALLDPWIRTDRLTSGGGLDLWLDLGMVNRRRDPRTQMATHASSATGSST